ncbi:MAG: hypothetical protein ACFFGZ_03840 [Candidatus Thorarchaeota archaeon]
MNKIISALVCFFLICFAIYSVPGSGSPPIRNDHDLVTIFGRKACDSHPKDATPDPSSEWLFFAAGSINDWSQYNIGGPAYPGDVLNNDKTILNGTDFDISASIPEYFEDGRFFPPYYFHTFIRVVNQSALLQWDVWFTDLTDMCAIKMDSFDPLAGLSGFKPLKQYPVVGYAAGGLDTEAETGKKSTTWSLVKNRGGEALACSGVNRLVLQVVSVQRDVIGVDVDWSDLVYRATDLTPENIAQLNDTFGRDTSAPPPALGEPYPLVLESSLKVSEYYGLNASGEVRCYGAGEDPDYPEEATYRMPVRQAMWRAEVGEGFTAQPVQRKRGWSFRIFNPIELPSGTDYPRCPGESWISGFDLPIVVLGLGLAAIVLAIRRRIK